MPKEKEKDEIDEKEEELVIVTDSAKNLDVLPDGAADDDGAPEPVELKGKSKAKSKSKGKADDDDSDDDEVEDQEEESDTRLGASEEDEAEEEKQKSSKGKSRRQRRKEAELRLRRELKFLEDRNETLEKQLMGVVSRQDQTEKAGVESRIKQVKGLIAQAEDVIAEGTTKNKGTEVVEATRIRDELKDELKTLEGRKAQSERAREQAPPLDPRMVAHARDFAREHPWFDGGKDLDSKIVRVIDNSLVEEGYDPTSKSYWKELRKRVSDRLPHRLKGANGHEDEDEDEDEDDDEAERPQKKRRVRAKERDDDGDEDERPAKKNGGGPRFRTGSPGRELKANEVYLSQERIQAMKDAGVWDDPETRKKHLKRYREWDRDHAKQNS
jgi:ElaB/YqjD/DUF883 family membrane-anchored ribosome-binding protein